MIFFKFGMVDFVILVVVGEQLCYGLELVQYINVCSGGFFELLEGSLYLVLL